MSTYSSQSSERVGRKRKRASPSQPDLRSDDGTRADFQSFQSQLSHKAAQLELAGASDADHDPSGTIHHFPHRGFSRRSSEVEGNAENDVDRRPKPRPRENDRKGHLDVLLRSIEQFLDQGQISKAARAYGLVLQLRPRSLPIDVRSYNLWAIGAEILMRQGEEQRRQRRCSPPGNEEDLDHDDPRQAFKARRGSSRRWGSAANMSKVKAYFETLIRQFPYDPKSPNKICSVDFWLASLSCEVYNAHTEYVMSLASLDDRADERNDDYIPEYEPHQEADGFDYDGPDIGDLGYLKSHETSQHSILANRKDNARKFALENMKDIIVKMEKLMEEVPYSKHGHFLRLRATSSLFAADLCIPIISVSPTELREAETRRNLEQQAAMNAIRELRNTRDDAGTIADVVFDTYLLRECDSEGAPSYLRASLPIREAV